MPGITVGVDGSEHSRRALEWAIREAGLRGAALTVLAVHQVAGNHWTGNPEIYPADKRPRRRCAGPRKRRCRRR